MGSDHSPFLYCFKHNPNETIAHTPAKWNLNKVDWKTWKKELTSTVKKNTIQTLDSIAKSLIETTNKFSNLSSKKIKTKTSKPFWNKECEEQVLRRKIARRNYKRNPSSTNRTKMNKETAITKKPKNRKKRRAGKTS